MKNIKSNKGFTLIELTIGIFVLSLLFLFIIVLANAGLSLSYNMIENQKQRENELQNLLYMTREIQSAGNIVITNNNKTLILYTVDGSSATNYVITSDGWLEEYLTINNNISGDITKLFNVAPSSNFQKDSQLPDTVDINITILNNDPTKKNIDFITSVSNRVGKSITVQ